MIYPASGLWPRYLFEGIGAFLYSGPRKTIKFEVLTF
ncbi:hypothetical protein Spb1_36170 [Planctopirus ephydatiae]|uniref:Uncharacterized protein n=1 Tax=Planctopirus ephydatiae TaxID=2528019 RepID=A0A518GSV3_9PLAN|nr:hypothetical protein Spb1_36170 [Planctopirus ephydatiae]